MMSKTSVVAALLLSVGILSSFSAAGAQKQAASVAITANSYALSGEQALTLGDYQTAETMFLQSLKSRSAASLAEEANWHAGLGEAYLWQAKLTQAYGELNKALAIASKSGPAGNAARARAFSSLAWLYHAQGKAGRIRFWGSDATTPVTTTIMSNGFPVYGSVPASFGYVPPCVGCFTPCPGCALS